MFGENSRLKRIIEELKAEIARLLERDAQMRRITEQALELARKEQFPQQAQTAPDPDGVIRSRANYQAPEVKFCPSCSISIRAEDWPQQCPRCKKVFGGEEWPDTIEG